MISTAGKLPSRYKRQWQPWITLAFLPFSDICWMKSIWNHSTQLFTNWSLTGLTRRSACRILRMFSTRCRYQMQRMPIRQRSQIQIAPLNKAQLQRWAQHQTPRLSLMYWMIVRTTVSMKSECRPCHVPACTVHVHVTCLAQQVTMATCQESRTPGSGKEATVAARAQAHATDTAATAAPHIPVAAWTP